MERLDSLLAQRHDRLEVIVVDDGSHDRSGDLAESVAARDERVRVVHTSNRGLGAARNEGLRHATGDLLGFVDSDDVDPPDAYAALVQRILEFPRRPGDRRHGATRGRRGQAGAVADPAAPR